MAPTVSRTGRRPGAAVPGIGVAAVTAPPAILAVVTGGRVPGWRPSRAPPTDSGANPSPDTSPAAPE